MFQTGLPRYLGLNSGRSVSINVNKMRKHFSRNIHGADMFPQCFPVSHTRNIVRFCIQDANYACATRQGILTKIRACEHLQNFCEHEQASTHLIFASNSSKGQILRALSNWMGPFNTPTWEMWATLACCLCFLNFSNVLRDYKHMIVAFEKLCVYN